MTSSQPRLRTTAAVAMTVITVTACASPAADEEESTSTQSVSVSMLPPIAHQGTTPADPDEAQAVVSARFDEDSAGREVTLEAKSGGGWADAGSTEVGADGIADFLVDQGGPTAYRVSAEAADNLPAATSAEVDAASYGEPDFAEPFDGDELSESWAHRGTEYNPEGLRLCSKGSPEAVEVGDGVASLKVLDDPTRDDPCEASAADGTSLGDFDYRLNGHIASNALFSYGIIAARIKFQRDKGQHGSFWLQSNLGIAPTDPLENGAEIDVVEYFGDSKDDRLASFVYYPTADGAVKEGDFIESASDFLADQDDDWWKTFHVFSVEWTEEEYIIRIDGQEAWRTTEGISGQPEFIVLSLLSSDYELPNLPDGGLPQAMTVDWVQHWEPAS